MEFFSNLYKAILYFFTGALFKIPLPGGSTLDISLRKEKSKRSLRSKNKFHSMMQKHL